MTNMKCITYNVNGLGLSDKRRAIFHYLHKKQHDIMFLQETHSKKSSVKRWWTKWGSKFWVAHGKQSSKGVAILFRKELNPTIHNVIASDEGRYVIIYCTINRKKFLLGNIYAPNLDNPDFFKKVFKELEAFAAEYTIIGGDMNLGIEPELDRRGYGKNTNNDNSARWLAQHLIATDLIDCWRHFCPDKSGFTWRRLRPKPVFSRLDYLFVSEQLLQYVTKTKINPGFRSDHSIVEIQIAFEPHVKGPGYWKFNVALLRDKDYLDKINKRLDIEMETEYQSYKDKWEIIQLAVRNTTLQFAAHRQKSKKNILQVLENKIKKIEQKMINQEGSILTESENHLLLLKKDRQELLAEKMTGAMLRAAGRWALEGEKPTKYYLNLEKTKALKKSICRLKTDHFTEITNPQEILTAMHDFYKKLYTSRGSVDMTYVDKVDTKTISEETKQLLDQDISLEEISLALKELPNGKTLGTSGLPADFLKVFWAKLKNLFAKMFQEIVCDGKLHLTARRGIISLIEKLTKDPLFLKNWRPLSLLNIDYKLLSKVLAKRLQIALPEIIHNDQTGFMKGRNAGEGIIKIHEIMENCDRKEKDGIIISFDFEKAFDNVEWTAIFAVLAKFGFGNKYIEMVKILYNQPISCVLNNGYWGDWFELMRSTRQGCCYSPLVFNLVVEMLGESIRQNKEIKGLYIGQKEVKLGQFADDLWTSLQPNTKNVNNLLREIEYFGKFSGLQLNHDKCAILKIGPYKNTEAKFYTKRHLFWSPNAIKILGVYVMPNETESFNKNFLDLLKVAQERIVGPIGMQRY